MPPATRSSATRGGSRNAVRPRRSEEASPWESHARATHSERGRHQPPEPALDHALDHEGALHVGPRRADEAHDVELVLAGVDGEPNDVRDREDPGQDEDAAEEGPHPPHQPHARSRGARSRAGRTGSRGLPARRRRPSPAARPRRATGDSAFRLTSSEAGNGFSPRSSGRALRSRNISRNRARACSRLTKLHRADRGVLAQAVLEARSDALLGAVLEVDDHLDLLGPARDHRAQAAGHGQEGPQDEEADRDRADRDRVDEAAAPEAGGGLGHEVESARRMGIGQRDYNPLHDRARRNRGGDGVGQDVAGRQDPRAGGRGSLPADRTGLLLQGRQHALAPRPRPRSTTTIPTPSTPRSSSRTCAT